MLLRFGDQLQAEIEIDFLVSPREPDADFRVAHGGGFHLGISVDQIPGQSLLESFKRAIGQ